MNLRAMPSDTIGLRREAAAAPTRRETRPVSPTRAGRELPPVVVIGGAANALSIARTLGRMKVQVYVVNKPTAAVRYSRFATYIPLPTGSDYVQHWAEFLTGRDSEYLSGAVLLAASDVGLRIIAEHRETLADRFLLDISNRDAQLALLDKLTTYRTAVAAGVPTPRFWQVQSLAELKSLQHELVYPLLVKPQLSFQFTDRFPAKFFIAANFDEVVTAFRRATDANVDCLLMEKVPGPDTRLCSYYTFLDEHGQPQFHFTKRIIRRNPPNMGLASYHVTDWTPEVRDVGLQLLQFAGLRGLGNVEFKFDERDQTWKLIECNARFTEANGLLAVSGLDLARFVYKRVTGLPHEPLRDYRRGVRLWYPVEDFRAFLALRTDGSLTTRQWLASLLHRQRLPLFHWTDPLPSLQAAWRHARNALGRMWQSIANRN